MLKCPGHIERWESFTTGGWFVTPTRTFTIDLKCGSTIFDF